ncbi:hypothetical protein ACO0K2_01725 [Undibacterium sp. MH2W]|uniref:hypothetical protein n=1 Tax=Undibacterium sp. MH2W TaxID=3413044 RepID=UPI003BF1C264
MKKVLSWAVAGAFGLLLIFLSFYVLTFGYHPITTPIDILPNKKDPHAIWAEFFTMLAGFGGILSPFISLATIYFLYGQVLAQREDVEKQKTRDEVASEFKELHGMIFEWAEREISGEVIRAGLASCLKSNQVYDLEITSSNEGFIFQWAKVPNEDSIHEYVCKIEIAKTGTLAQWIAKANKILTENNFCLYQVVDEEQNYFPMLATSLAGHLKSLLMFAKKAHVIGVDKTSIKFRLQYYRDLADLLHKARLLDDMFLDQYDALISSCSD